MSDESVLDRGADTAGAIDKRRARQSFGRAAHSYDESAALQRLVGERMLTKLEAVRLEPQRILDIGTGTGGAISPLMQRFRGARLLALDFALPMLGRARRRGRWLRRPVCICGDFEQLPLADASIDLVHSSLAFQWANNLPRVFAECRRVLRPGGLFVFSTFGPDTLKELRTAWAEVDGASHVSPFIDMHDVGDMLGGTGFADPVMDADWVTMTYGDVKSLMVDLKGIGAGNATAGRQRTLTGKGRMAAFAASYEAFRDPKQRLPATYEVVYGHAWVPEQTQVQGETRISVDAIGGRQQIQNR